MGSGRTPAPAVSVIVPTHQRREQVRSAVASVLAQTYRDFELIVVDDGSSDGTREALAPLLGERFRYRWQDNAGPAAARNHGVSLARGAILAFLDSDDRWLADHLAVVTEMLELRPEVVLASTTPGHAIAGRAKPRRARLRSPLPGQIVANPVGWPSAVAVRTDRVRSVGGFDESMWAGEGEELWMRMALRGGVFALLRRRTIERNELPDSHMHASRRRGLYLDAFERKAAGAQEALRGSTDDRSLTLLDKARGAGEMATALRALDRGDDVATGRGLERAVALLPELAAEPALLAGVLGRLPRADEPDEHLRHLTAIACLFPSPDSDTAVHLRMRAVLAAARLLRVREALRLLFGCSPRATFGLLVRRLSPEATRAGQRAAVSGGR